jgi:hypothetical protein
MSDFFKFMAEWGVWDVFQTLITIVGGIVVFFYLFPRRSIENFYIDATRAANPPYPKVIRIEMRNLTNEPLYVLSRGFRFGDVIHASPLAAIDHATQTCEVKFPGPQPDNLTEIDTLVRHGQPVSTWVPVDPNHADDVIDAALQNRSVGVLRLTCRRQSGRTSSVRLLSIPV